MSTVGPLLGQQAQAATAYMRAHTAAANLHREALGAAAVIYREPEKAITKALDLAAHASSAFATDAIRGDPSLCGDLVGSTTFGLPDRGRRAAQAALPACLSLLHDLHHSHAALQAAAAGAPSPDSSERARQMEMWQAASVDLATMAGRQGLASSPHPHGHAEPSTEDLPPLPSWWTSEANASGPAAANRAQDSETDREP